MTCFYLRVVLLLGTLLGVVHGQRKLVCLDDKSDLSTALWTSTFEIKGVASVSNLPKSFGDLKALVGSGIWYLEGSSPPKEISFKGPLNTYSNKAKSVTIYIKYFTNSQRRLALYPTKLDSSGGSLSLLPSSNPVGQAKWNEVTKEIDPNESPIEITAALGSNEYILFEKIVVAVDTALPSDLSLSCKLMNSPPTLSPLPGGPTASSSLFGTGTSSTRKISTPRTPECPAPPVFPECKCNCNCNCSKC